MYSYQKYLRIYVPLLVSVILTFSCAVKTQKNLSSSLPNATYSGSSNSISVNNSDSAISTLLKSRSAELSGENLIIEGDTLFTSFLLPNFYDSTYSSLVWKSYRNRVEATDILLSAYENGLIPDEYHSRKLVKYNLNYSDLNISELIDYDFLLLDGILLYSYHLLNGKLDPETLKLSRNRIKESFPIHLVGILKEAMEVETLGAIIPSLEPQNEEYESLKSRLNDLTELEQTGGWESISYTKTLRPHDRDSAIVKIRSRLRIEKYLELGEDTGNMTYDPLLFEGVKNFQSTHGLNPDGVIGKQTLERMNISVSDKKQMVVTNLERLRWIDFSGLTRYIRVNIAGFYLQFLENGNLMFQSRVMVGEEQTQTPEFSDLLDAIVFNPTWTVPRSIATQEILPKLQKDPNYLKKNHMVLLNAKGEMQSGYGINWNSYNSNYLPFIFRQEPGPKNALGQVKFMFPNKYAIFLHDTPSKMLFEKERRTFSHGCIRLEKPVEFAQILLEREKDAWSRNAIDSILDTGQTTTVRLQKGYPIELIYQTVELGIDGQIHFYEDVYGRDEKIYRKLVVK